MRGTDRSIKVFQPTFRFIPACAGNRTNKTPVLYVITVHPRVCGEQRRNARRTLTLVGSSPRVRGTVINDDQDGGIGRFIPACAGNSWAPRCAQQILPVHPRVCGEQNGAAKRFHKPRGSSPRVRGTANGRVTRNECLRFIPACAGNRPTTEVMCITNPVHPRVCGEQGTQTGQVLDSAGSSPRVRGTDHRSTAPRAVSRFIPACAGNRMLLKLKSKLTSVHPRVCGEQASITSCLTPARGSSPRVRGTGFSQSRNV